jgi:hypothetical protein
MTSQKRAAILLLIKQQAHPATIITTATEPSADPDYERRIRLWAADCVARGIHLLTDDDRRQASAAIMAARRFAKGLIDITRLAEFDCPPGSELYRNAKRSAFTMTAEIRLAAAMTAQLNIYVGALTATTHIRRAIENTTRSRSQITAQKELNWQVRRLMDWLSDSEPAEWPISTA